MGAPPRGGQGALLAFSCGSDPPGACGAPPVPKTGTVKKVPGPAMPLTRKRGGAYAAFTISRRLQPVVHHARGIARLPGAFPPRNGGSGGSAANSLAFD